MNIGYAIGSAFLILIVAGVIGAIIFVPWFVVCVFISEIQRARIVMFMLRGDVPEKEIIKIINSVKFEDHVWAAVRFKNGYKLYVKAFTNYFGSKILEKLKEE